MLQKTLLPFVFFHCVVFLPHAIRVYPDENGFTPLSKHTITQVELDKKKGANAFYSTNRLKSANISGLHRTNDFSMGDGKDELVDSKYLGQITDTKLSLGRQGRNPYFCRDIRFDLNSGRSSKPPLKAGKVGLEFLAGGVAGGTGSLVLGFIGGAITSRPDEVFSGLGGMAIGGMLGILFGSSVGVQLVGSYGDETGAYWATLLGSTGGMAASLIYIALRVREDSAEWFDWAMIYALPAAGAVLGFNLTRRYDTPPASGSALLNFEDGQIIFTVPDFCLHPNPFIPGDYLQTVQLLNVRF